MRITVEVNSIAYRVEPENVAVVIEVALDDQRNCHLERKLREDEIKSRFDIVWDHIGVEIKKELERLKQ